MEGDVTPFAYLNATPLPIVAIPRKVTKVTPEDELIEDEPKPLSIRAKMLNYLAEHGKTEWNDLYFEAGDRYKRKSFDEAVRRLRKDGRIEVINTPNGDFIKLRVM